MSDLTLSGLRDMDDEQMDLTLSRLAVKKHTATGVRRAVIARVTDAALDERTRRMQASTHA